MNLYEHKAVYQDLQNRIEAGEDLDDLLASIDEKLEDKADGYARVIANMEAQAEIFQNEEKRMKEKKEKLKAGADQLRQVLFQRHKVLVKLRTMDNANRKHAHQEKRSYL